MGFFALSSCFADLKNYLVNNKLDRLSILLSLILKGLNIFFDDEMVKNNKDGT
jgi:hypothetical protein